MTASDFQKVKDILSQNGVEFAGIFGSRARGEEKPESDIDIMIRFKEGKTKGLLELISLERKLSEILGLEVDLITQDSISPYIKESVLKDLKVIYQ